MFVYYNTLSEFSDNEVSSWIRVRKYIFVQYKLTGQAGTEI